MVIDLAGTSGRLVRFNPAANGKLAIVNARFNIRVRHNGNIVSKSFPDTGSEQTVVVMTGPEEVKQ